MITDILAFGFPGGAELVVIFFVTLFVSVLPAIAFWRICSKAGFPGVLGLLMFVPIANVLLPLYLAFAEWPVLRGDEGM